MCHFLLVFAVRYITRAHGRWCRSLLQGIGILIFLSCIALTLALAELMPLPELITKIQERYEKSDDLKARFIQETTIKAMNKTDREEGILYVKNPKRMLWNYLKPKAKKLIINPKRAWLYIPDDHVVYIQEAENVYKSKLAVKFLSGIGKLMEDFHIHYAKPDPIDGKGNFLLTLSPKVSDMGIDTLHLTVDKDTFQVIQCGFTDLYGNTTRIRLSDIKINNGLSDKLFHFKPPAGVEVFNMP